MQPAALHRGRRGGARSVGGGDARVGPAQGRVELVTSGGFQICYMEHSGCHQMYERVLTHDNNVEKSAPTLPQGARRAQR
jgi:hypothetical protein